MGSGWEPLCKFLGKDFPDVPFPLLNEGKEFAKHNKNMYRAGFLLAWAAIKPWAFSALAKHQIPDDHYEFKNPEQRFRQRHLDLIMNEKVRDVFITRAKVDTFIRRWLNERNFIDVQTPTMNAIAGGVFIRLDNQNLRYDPRK
ncbi:lysyl-tRNA synthetase [Apiospora saccharicola]